MYAKRLAAALAATLICCPAWAQKLSNDKVGIAVLTDMSGLYSDIG